MRLPFALATFAGTSATMVTATAAVTLVVGTAIAGAYLISGAGSDGVASGQTGSIVGAPGPVAGAGLPGIIVCWFRRLLACTTPSAQVRLWTTAGRPQGLVVELLLLLSLVLCLLALGFAAGYAARAYKSRRRRNRAARFKGYGFQK